MTNKRLVILCVVLTILVVGGGLCMAICSKPVYFSALGSLVGGVAGLLAVIWFSASLFYQSRQLREQREQFLENFRCIREDARRNALVLAKDILGRAEERAMRANAGLKQLADILSVYIDISQCKIILESKDPNLVLEYAKTWMTEKEGPAVFLMRGLKAAAEMYFRAIGRTGVDYSADPELFVAAYGATLWDIPYFDAYQGIAPTLAELMVRMKPLRKSVLLAWSVACAKGELKGFMKTEEIVKDIREHEKAGYPLPAIAKDFPISSAMPFA